MSIIAQTTGTNSARDFDWLKGLITAWLHRSDLDSRIPDFIMLAEQRINRIARVRTMENEVTLETEIGSRFIALPDNFSMPLAVYLESIQPRCQLDAVVPEVLPVTSAAGMPRFWCIDGSNLAFERPADQAYEITLRQVGNFKLAPAIPINALLTNYPDLYLYGALMAAATYVRDTANLAIWKGLFEEAVREMNQNESRSRAVAPLRTELGQLLGQHHYDIRRGS